MISAGEVGAVFIVKDEASPVLKKLMEQFEALGKSIESTKKLMQTFKLPAGLNASLKVMADNLAAIGAATDRASGQFGRNFDLMDASINRTTDRMAALAAEIRGVAAESASLGRGIGTFSGRGGGGSRSSIPNGPSIGVSGPRAEGPGGTGFHAGGDGLGGLIGGLVAGWFGTKMVGAGGTLNDQQILLKNMGGISDAEISKTTGMAQSATLSVIGTTIAENMKGMRELMGVMPSLDEAREKYPEVMRVAKQLEAITGKPAEDSLQTLAKAVELRGGGMNPLTHQLDPDRFAKEVQAAGAAIGASGGLVNDRSLYQFMQTAGPAARLMQDPIAFYKSALTAIMDMGGFRAGTATTALDRQLLGGKMAWPTAVEMDRLGLLVPGKFRKGGTGTIVDPGGIQGEDIIKDPNQGLDAWANKILMPALTAKGITSQADVMQTLIKVFGTSTGQRLGALYVQNGPQIERDKQMIDKYNSITAYQNLSNGSYALNLENATKAFSNMMESVGSASTPAAISVMKTFADSMNAVAGAALKHPQAASDVTMGVFGSAAALVVGGASKWIGGKLGLPFTWSGVAKAGLSVGADVANLPMLIDTVTDPSNRSPQAVAGDKAWVDWFKRNVQIGPWFESNSDFKARQDKYASGVGYDGSLPGGKSSVDNKVTVNVYLPGGLLVGTATSNTHSGGVDGSSIPLYPGMMGRH